MSDSPIDLKAVTNQLYDLLEPLESEERQRVIKAALTLLGDDASVATGDGKGKKQEEADTDVSGFPTRASSWMKKYEVTPEQLAHVFHIDGETVDVILDSVPGNVQKQQAINAYILTGVAELLKTGNTKFTDKAGREACEKMGCYGKTNHATCLKKPGNVLSGSKNAGWTLTGPGLKSGADLVKDISE